LTYLANIGVDLSYRDARFVGDYLFPPFPKREGLFYIFDGDDRCKACQTAGIKCRFNIVGYHDAEKWYIFLCRGKQDPIRQRPKFSMCVDCKEGQKGDCYAPIGWLWIGPGFKVTHGYHWRDNTMVTSNFLKFCFGRNPNGGELPGMGETLARLLREASDVQPKRKSGTPKVEAKAMAKTTRPQFKSRAYIEDSEDEVVVASLKGKKPVVKVGEVPEGPKGKKSTVAKGNEGGDSSKPTKTHDLLQQVVDRVTAVEVMQELWFAKVCAGLDNIAELLARGPTSLPEFIEGSSGAHSEY
jgi:hypothetical protein